MSVTSLMLLILVILVILVVIIFYALFDMIVFNLRKKMNIQTPAEYQSPPSYRIDDNQETPDQQQSQAHSMPPPPPPQDQQPQWSDQPPAWGDQQGGWADQPPQWDQQPAQWQTPYDQNVPRFSGGFMPPGNPFAPPPGQMREWRVDEVPEQNEDPPSQGHPASGSEPGRSAPDIPQYHESPQHSSPPQPPSHEPTGEQTRAQEPAANAASSSQEVQDAVYDTPYDHPPRDRMEHRPETGDGLTVEQAVHMPEAEQVAQQENGRIVLDGQNVVKFEKPKIHSSELVSPPPTPTAAGDPEPTGKEGTTSQIPGSPEQPPDASPDHVPQVPIPPPDQGSSPVEPDPHPSQPSEASSIPHDHTSSSMDHRSTPTMNTEPPGSGHPNLGHVHVVEDHDEERKEPGKMGPNEDDRE